MVMYIVASSRIKYCRGSKTIPAYLSFAIRLLLPPPSYFRGEDPDAATSVNQYHVCVGSSHSFHVKKVQLHLLNIVIEEKKLSQ